MYTRVYYWDCPHSKLKNCKFPRASKLGNFVVSKSPHLTRTSELWSDFLNEEGEDEEACFNGVIFGDVVAVFEGSVFSGETPYMETVVMHNVPPSSTSPGVLDYRHAK